MKNKELFDTLMEKLEALLPAWEAYNDGKPLAHFDGGFDMYYIDITILRDSLDVLKHIYGTTPASASSMNSKLHKLRFEYSEIDDIYGEYLMGIPDPLLHIFYLVASVFEGHSSQVEEFNKEHLQNYIKRADELLESKE